MAKNKTSKCRHQSGYGANWITDAQKLAEMMCERKHSPQPLPFKFWLDKSYFKEFMTQLNLANGLLKIYRYEVILDAIQSPQGKKIFSLGANFLDPLLKESQEKFGKIKNYKSEQLGNTADKPRKKEQSNSIRNKLK